MKHCLIALLMLVGPAAHSPAQTCRNGLCYPQQPTAPARLVTPIEPANQTPHDAHCRIHIGDGTVGSGTLVAKNDATGLVLTCSHLFDGAASSTVASSIVVAFPDGRRFGARLIDRDPPNDLAALLIQRPEGVPIAVDDFDPTDNSEPTGVLTACGYGASGQFRPASGAVTGAAQAIGATFPSLKIGIPVRPGDSGGGVLDRAGRLVGVVWGCRDGETYLTCGSPLREFLHRIGQRPTRGERASARGPVLGSASGNPQPTVDWQAWRDEIDSRLDALDANKQDRGDYLQAGDLNAYAKRSESQQAIERIEQTSTSRIESLRTTLHDLVEARIKEGIATVNPGLFGGLSLGKMLVGALGLSGPVALAVIVAGGLASRAVPRPGKTVLQKPSQTIPFAVDTPPPPQQTVPESHYVPVQRDDFARAHQWAREQVARKYPGATEVLTTLESLIKQQLAAS